MAARSGLALVVAWASCLSVFGLCLAYTQLADVPWSNHDVAFNVRIAVNFLAGSPLYTEQVTSNPPAILIAAAATTAVAGWLGLSPLFGFQLFVIAVAARGFAVLRSAGRHLGAGPEGEWLLALAYGVLFVYTGVGAHQLGQREHVFMLAFLPIALARLVGTGHGRWLAVDGLLLGLLGSAKPFFAAMVIAVEVPVALRDRELPWGRWSWLIAGALAPIAAMAFDSPDSVIALLRDVVPFHLSGAYAAYDGDVSAYLVSGSHAMTLGSIAVAGISAFLLARRVRIPPATLVSVASCAVVAYGSVFAQRKFWPYHSIPIHALAWFTASVCLALFAAGLDPRERRVVVRSFGLVLALGLALSVWQLASVMRATRPRTALALAPLLERHDEIYVLSPGIDYDFTILSFYTAIGQVDPWSHNMFFPSLLRIDEEERRKRAIETYVAGVSRRIDVEQPGLVLFAPYSQALPPGATLHDYFVDEAGLFPRPDYRRLSRAELESCCGVSDWTIYERK